MHLNRPTTITLIVITAISITGLYLVGSEEGKSNILHSIFIALLVSSIFYIGTAAIPEIQRRKRIRNGLIKKYHYFKMSCIDLFLIASNSQDYDYKDRENLLNHEEFRRYFDIRCKGTQNRWDLVATSIDDGDYIFDELVMELDLLINELKHARASVEIFDDDVDDFFTSMMQTLHRVKISKPGTDDYKYFCRTLWSIFTRWNLSDGQRQDDYIQTMIERI